MVQNGVVASSHNMHRGVGHSTRCGCEKKGGGRRRSREKEKKRRKKKKEERKKDSLKHGAAGLMRGGAGGMESLLPWSRFSRSTSHVTHHVTSTEMGSCVVGG